MNEIKSMLNQFSQRSKQQNADKISDLVAQIEESVGDDITAMGGGL